MRRNNHAGVHALACLRGSVNAELQQVVALIAFAGLLCINLPAIADQPGSATDTNSQSDPTDQADQNPAPEFTQATVRGRVVYLAAALQDMFGISTVPAAAERVLALKTPDDQLVPIVENLRGRAFRKDERLREMDVEILARRYDDQPFVQVLKLFEIDDRGRRYEVDYWCDVCAIVMFESGPCSCCQDDNRLRKRLVQE